MMPPLWLYAFSFPLVSKHAQILAAVKILKTRFLTIVLYILVFFEDCCMTKEILVDK